MPKISLITAVYNRSATIRDAIESVVHQRDADIEYIVVDGNSTDGTEEIIRSYSSRVDRYIREADTGIYNALNKGIAASTGEIIGFIHADDMLTSDSVMQAVSKAFHDPEIDAAYGDLVYVDSNQTSKVVRYWKSGIFNRYRFRWGWMPPHPTVYIRRKRYLELGGYREDFQISADYELLVRMFYKHRLKTEYIHDVLVTMRQGGKSNVSVQNRLLANREDRKAWEVNQLRPPLGLQFLKPMSKLHQFWERPPHNLLQSR